MGASGTEQTSDLLNIVGGADLGRSDHVDALLQSEFDYVVRVSFGDTGQLSNAAGESEELVSAETTVVLCLNFDRSLNKITVIKTAKIINISPSLLH